jgi:hypothetical protein
MWITNCVAFNNQIQKQNQQKLDIKYKCNTRMTRHLVNNIFLALYKDQE